MKHYITKINIKKVRHLENIEINLSDKEKKHLILTGRNGSGKTSVLDAIKRYLQTIQNRDIVTMKGYSDELQRIERELQNDPTDYDTIMEHKRLQEKYDYYCKNLQLEISDDVNIISEYGEGEFVLAYFNAERTSSMKIPNSVPKVELNDTYKIDENIDDIFLNYLVYLKTQQSFARNENDEKVVSEIQEWFENFEGALKELFEDDSIRLVFDYKNLNFKIQQKNREDYGFDALSHGYSAVLDIFINLILRMEKNKKLGYDVEGIVIIDEIETHLHIELQKKILPFLTNFFKNIQFIISTHSPFVLNSIDNAVIYDLEKKIEVEDLSSYAYDGVVEGYFEIDKYSAEIKDKMLRYENLVFKENKSEEEENEEQSLRIYLRNVPETLAEELVYKFRSIELKRKTLEIQKKA